MLLLFDLGLLSSFFSSIDQLSILFFFGPDLAIQKYQNTEILLAVRCKIRNTSTEVRKCQVLFDSIRFVHSRAKILRIGAVHLSDSEKTKRKTTIGSVRFCS